MQTYATRTEIPLRYTWDLTTIYSSDEVWEESFKQAEGLLPQLDALKGTLAESGEALLHVLETRNMQLEQLEKLYVYASMHKDENTKESLYQGMEDRAKQFNVQAVASMAFITPEILALPEETLQQFLEATPGLALYRHELEDINRGRPHTLSPEMEAVLAAAGDITSAPDDIFGMINNADLQLPVIKNEKGEDTQLTKGNYLEFIRNTDRRVRKDAFEALHETFLKQRNTLAATLSAEVKGHIFYQKQRNYPSCRARRLFRYNIPETVYDQLIETVHEHLPLLQRYLTLRKKLLRLDELHIYDIYVPVVEDVDVETPYEAAQEIILQALAPLGEEYIRNVRRAFAERWLDVYETPGKRSGAYSGGAYATSPFMLLNYANNRNSIYTLIHEMGHSMHSLLTKTHQPFEYGDYTIFVAEVASTFNEGLLTEHLLKTAPGNAEKMAILNHALEDIRGTLYRQTMFAEFEQYIHHHAEHGEALTAESLSTAYKALNELYFGEAVTVDDLIAIEWARIPHFYYDFYVYQYATGIAASTALVQKVLTEGQSAVDRYLGFLKSGGSEYSIDLLKKAGVDMTTPEPVRQAFTLFESYLNQLETLVAETP